MVNLRLQLRTVRCGSAVAGRPGSTSSGEAGPARLGGFVVDRGGNDLLASLHSLRLQPLQARDQQLGDVLAALYQKTTALSVFLGEPPEDAQGLSDDVRHGPVGPAREFGNSAIGVVRELDVELGHRLACLP